MVWPIWAELLHAPASPFVGQQHTGCFQRASFTCLAVSLGSASLLGVSFIGRLAQAYSRNSSRSGPQRTSTCVKNLLRSNLRTGTASLSYFLFSKASPKGSQMQQLGKLTPPLDEKSNKYFCSGVAIHQSRV